MNNPLLRFIVAFSIAFSGCQQAPEEKLDAHEEHHREQKEQQRMIKLLSPQADEQVPVNPTFTWEQTQRLKELGWSTTYKLIIRDREDLDFFLDYTTEETAFTLEDVPLESGRSYSWTVWPYVGTRQLSIGEEIRTFAVR